MVILERCRSMSTGRRVFGWQRVALTYNFKSSSVSFPHRGPTAYIRLRPADFFALLLFIHVYTAVVYLSLVENHAICLLVYFTVPRFALCTPCHPSCAATANVVL